MNLLLALADTTAPKPTKEGRFFDAATARTYLRAGNATVTLRSAKTGTRFTYKVGASEDGNVHFVSVLSGGDNEGSYRYMGIIKRDVFQRTERSKIEETAGSMVAFKWAWQKMAQGKMPDALEVWHSGCCGRCGRKLTVPASIASGFGPECLGKAMGG